MVKTHSPYFYRKRARRGYMYAFFGSYSSDGKPIFRECQEVPAIEALKEQKLYDGSNFAISTGYNKDGRACSVTNMNMLFDYKAVLNYVAKELNMAKLSGSNFVDMLVIDGDINYATDLLVQDIVEHEKVHGTKKYDLGVHMSDIRNILDMLKRENITVGFKGTLIGQYAGQYTQKLHSKVCKVQIRFLELGLLLGKSKPKPGGKLLISWVMEIGRVNWERPKVPEPKPKFPWVYWFSWKRKGFPGKLIWAKAQPGFRNPLV